MSTRSSHSDELPEYELKAMKSPIKHREMPVDVPESFVEIIKVPPRYPPPPHLSSRSSLLSHNNGSIGKGSRTTTFNSPSSNSSSSSITSPISAPPPPEKVLKSRISLSSSFDETFENQKPQPQVAVIKIRNEEVLDNYTSLYIVLFIWKILYKIHKIVESVNLSIQFLFSLFFPFLTHRYMFIVDFIILVMSISLFSISQPFCCTYLSHNNQLCISKRK